MSIKNDSEKGKNRDYSAQPPDFETIKKLNAKNYMNVFNRQNLCFISGEANVLTDIYGKKYVDFVSGLGVNTLGYNHPKLTQAVCDQAKRLIHSSNLYYNREQAILCEKILDGTIFDKMFLANSGAEANECAIKLVRKYYKLKEQNKPCSTAEQWARLPQPVKKVTTPPTSLSRKVSSTSRTTISPRLKTCSIHATT